MSFSSSITDFRLLPEAFIQPLAHYLPYLEILTGSALILGWVMNGALLATGGMLVAFMAALISALLRGLDISCGCFGTGDVSYSTITALFMDACLMATWIVLVRRKLKTLI